MSTNTDKMAMYVRVKRKKTTYFVNCNPTDTTLQLKAKLQLLTGNLMKHQRLVLLDDYHILDDGKTLSQQQVQNNDVIAMTLWTSNGEWEDIDIDNVKK